ncbi:hypothetical protein ACFY2W_26075 [Streptomyces sp. NPDC001262]|uniref:hypothetical protein n=1 Tax=Streptomyces TaxID=1883 RepID=UPI0036766757
MSEAAFATAAPGAGLAALRGAPRSSPGPDRIRMQGAYLHTPVLEAFDGMLHVPQSTVFGGLASLSY